MIGSSYIITRKNGEYDVRKVSPVYICDRACENRECGLKYTIPFDETYLNTEM